MPPTTADEGTCLERLLLSGLFRRYVECTIVLFFPWVLLTEQPAEWLIESEAKRP
jgi:hypothetical protein